MQRLIATARHNRTRLLDLEWSRGILRALHTDGDLGLAVERWRTRGLQEWVGPEGRRTLRVTRSDEPGFLQRLSNHLRESYDLVVFQATDVIEASASSASISAVCITGSASPSLGVTGPTTWRPSNPIFQYPRSNPSHANA